MIEPRERSWYCKCNRGIRQCSLQAGHHEPCVFNRERDTIVELAYPERYPQELEPYYSYNVRAMTVEELHSKADIATQIAWRDKEIDRLAPKGFPDITCPHCGDKYESSEVEYDGDERDMTCAGCGAEFDITAHVACTFTCVLRKPKKDP